MTAMMRLNTEPMTPGLRAGRGQSDGMAVLIQVPRVDEPSERIRAWRWEAARRARPAWSEARRSSPAGTFRVAGDRRPRRRLRRGVRRAAWSLLVLVAMAATFTMGWTTRGGSPGAAAPVVVALELEHAGIGPAPGGGERRPDPPAPEAEADARAIGPALGAPVADAEVPVVLPGYVLPDDTREEPAHEGS